MVQTGPPTFDYRNSFLNRLPGSIFWKLLDLGKQQSGAIPKLNVPSRDELLIAIQLLSDILARNIVVQ